MIGGHNLSERPDMSLTVHKQPHHYRSSGDPPQMGDEVFPYRMKVRPVAVFPEPLEFNPLIEDLRFITNKKMWSGHLRQAMREIPEEGLQGLARFAETYGADFNRIEAVAKVGEELKVLDLTKPTVIKAVTESDNVKSLYMGEHAQDYC